MEPLLSICQIHEEERLPGIWRNYFILLVGVHKIYEKNMILYFLVIIIMIQVWLLRIVLPLFDDELHKLSLHFLALGNEQVMLQQSK